ncbi:hypothetical protein BpHYR1_025682 [Brachionus plicatilis]|uniref:Uncharacterized protein n=1 Tax=Brachionus plicatilis TaxID=10195 RepID=A0A3M7SHF4_BRAPC|nr:hypothetical protein BpHYR1_025682 [Brachionus plicatilis]
MRSFKCGICQFSYSAIIVDKCPAYNSKHFACFRNRVLNLLFFLEKVFFYSNVVNSIPSVDKIIMIANFPDKIINP